MTLVTRSVFAVLASLTLMGNNTPRHDDIALSAASKGIDWLVSVQGSDGGWGQDGGAKSTARASERLESSNNDPANTAVAVLALIRAGHTPTRGAHAAALSRGVDFVIRSVEQSPEQGLAITPVTGSQIQRKLGPFIDTFLSSMMLSEVDGQMPDTASNARLRRALEKVVRKVEQNQLSDGSWNISGGWAPILGTSLASRGLYGAQQKGVRVNNQVMARLDDYTKNNTGAVASGAPGGSAGGVSAGVRPGVDAASASVPLYARAQALEQMSRTSADREKNAKEYRAMASELRSDQFVAGYGSMGGEEFFSYLNISDSLRRAGGKEWTDWNGNIKTRLVKLQNNDGTWAGHHCITGRVAVTSAAVLTLLAERAPVVISQIKANPSGK